MNFSIAEALPNLYITARLNDEVCNNETPLVRLAWLGKAVIDVYDRLRIVHTSRATPEWTKIDFATSKTSGGIFFKGNEVRCGEHQNEITLAQRNQGPWQQSNYQ